MSNDLAKREAMLPAVPTRDDLQALGDADLWTFAERASEVGEMGKVAWELTDERLRRWVEVEGKTYTEISKIVGRSTSRISQRAIGLGLTPKSNRGRPRISTTGNSDPDEEVIDAEVVEDDELALPPPTESEEYTIRKVEHDRGYEASVQQAVYMGVQHPDRVDGSEPTATPVARAPRTDVVAVMGSVLLRAGEAATAAKKVTRSHLVNRPDAAGTWARELSEYVSDLQALLNQLEESNA